MSSSIILEAKPLLNFKWFLPPKKVYNSNVSAFIKKMLPSKALLMLVSCWQKALFDVQQMSSENPFCRKISPQPYLQCSLFSFYFCWCRKNYLAQIFRAVISIHKNLFTDEIKKTNWSGNTKILFRESCPL